MANFKLVISDPKTRKAYQKEVEQAASGLLGKKLGEKVSLDSLGLSGYEMEITGGSDKQGFPMRRDVEGTGRKKIILSVGPGFHPKRKGHRKRKSIRGNTVSADTIQVNGKIVKHGTKAIDQVLGKPKEEKKEEGKEEPKKEEAPKAEKVEEKEAPKEEKPAEKKEEAKPEEKKEEPKKEEAPKEEKKEEPKAEEAEKKMSIKKLEEKEKEKS